MQCDLVVIGGGAAGFFAAIRLAEMQPGAKTCIIEAGRNPLSKVEISGGGRCNVTHACFDPDKLAGYYPRGGTELRQAFHKFHPGDLVKWFQEKGVKLKTESDGRMFPVTDASSTIIQCFLKLIQKYQISLRLSTRAMKWNREDKLWKIELMNGEMLHTENLLIAAGSDLRVWKFLESSGYRIVSPVPSLFTFNIEDEELQLLQGISKSNVIASIPSIQMHSHGPLLITHWGMSGPAILKLSAWGARHLFDAGYVFDLQIDWTGGDSSALLEIISQQASAHPKRFIHKYIIPGFPARLWKYICQRAMIPEFMSGAEFGRKPMKRLKDVLTKDIYRVTGKSTFKEEFVTAGGVDLSEINMDTFESKKHPGLFMAGEVLNIDAVTGGFNFQAAWTGGEMVARRISRDEVKGKG